MERGGGTRERPLLKGAPMADEGTRRKWGGRKLIAARNAFNYQVGVGLPRNSEVSIERPEEEGGYRINMGCQREPAGMAKTNRRMDGDSGDQAVGWDTIH